MQKNIVVILSIVIIVLLSVLMISSNANGMKLKKSQAQIAALEATVTQKNAEILSLTNAVSAKQQEADTMRNELETVKTELANTVIRLQALPGTIKK